jgi:myo-inositol 2-dehydrogenase/D-chiro-inositol 1-dehydrogenase
MGRSGAPLDLGVIGCGRVAERFYLPALSRLPGVGRLAFADPLPERRALLSGRVPGGAAFASAEELLEKTGVDAVIVTSPAVTHAAMTALALEAGLPVLVEKPLSTSPAEAEQLRPLAAVSRAWVMMGFNRRYWDPVSRLRQVVREHRAQRPRSVRLVFTGDSLEWAPIAERGDTLGDLAPHQIDLLRYLFDQEILGVRARWTNPDAVEMRVRLAGGVTAECVAAQRGPHEESVTVEYGRERYCVRAGSERIGPAGGPVRAALDLAESLVRRVRARPSSLRASFQRQLASFLECVRTGAAPEVTLEDGIAAVHAVEAARRSAAGGGSEVVIRAEGPVQDESLE